MATNAARKIPAAAPFTAAMEHTPGPGPRTWTPRTRPDANHRVTRLLPYTGEGCVEWAWCLAEAARIHGQPARVSHNTRDGRKTTIPARVAEARHTDGSCAVFVNRVATSVDDSVGNREGEDA